MTNVALQNGGKTMVFSINSTVLIGYPYVKEENLNSSHTKSIPDAFKSNYARKKQ